MKRADYAHVRYRWAGATVQIYVNGKPKGAASVVAQTEGLPDTASVETRRAQWRGALEALRACLAEPSARRG